MSRSKGSIDPQEFGTVKERLDGLVTTVEDVKACQTEMNKKIDEHRAAAEGRHLENLKQTNNTRYLIIAAAVGQSVLSADWGKAGEILIALIDKIILTAQAYL